MLDFIMTSGETTIRLAGVIGVLLVIIFVHEMGHYLVGRWCGIGASAFSLGFGPELCGYTDKRGTRWKLAAIPLGGYVKFIGDENAASQPVKGRSAEDLRPDSFAAASAWKRSATVFAGPFFNALFTVVVLAFLAFMSGRTVNAPVVDQVVPHSPAAEAGFKAGDRFLTMQGKKVTSFEDILHYVMTHEGETIEFVVRRAGKTLSLSVIPRVETVDDGFGNTIRVGRIGIMGAGSPERSSKVSYSAWQALGYGVQQSADIVKQTGRFIAKLFQGKGDRCQLSGPVRTAQIAWKVSDFGFLALLQLAALFSISIGLFNLFPLPPLDGGHLVFYLIEAVTGRRVPLSIQENFFRAGFVLVLLLMVLAIVNNSIPC